MALVQTVDFFPPLTNDPFQFGQIAAANSLSDVYAMGGRPITALNVVGFPNDDLPLEVLGEILRGGAEKVKESGAVIAGGHSVSDKEIKYGLAVTGLVDPAKLIKNEGATVGDVLILTKPIGTGCMTAAYQKDKIDSAIWEACCAAMMHLNRAAGEAMIEVGVKGATDITGYGLLGHGGEMAEASGVTLEIEAAKVPLLEGALGLSRKGFITRGRDTNAAYLADRLVSAASVPDDLLSLLLDAQTSGGLLIALSEEKADAFLAKNKNGGSADSPNLPWAIIGRVTEKSEALVRIL